MNDLEEYIDAANDREDVIIEFESPSDNTDNRGAVFKWGNSGSLMVARLVVSGGKMHAEVSAYRDGVRQAVDVLQLEDAAMIYSRDT
jgi:hypothetical protein